MTKLDPDTAALQFNRGIGEFSPEKDIAFEIHLKRLHFKHVLKTISYETWWYSYRPRIVEDDFADIMIRESQRMPTAQMA